jgi:hypothetical protein
MPVVTVTRPRGREATGVIIMATNSCSLLALARCKRMMKQLQILTSSLAVSDFLTGAAFVLDGSRYGKNNLQTLPILPCWFRFHIFVILHFATYFTVTAMVLDRVLSLYLHMRYACLVTRGRLAFAVGIIWLLAIGVTVVFLDGLDGYHNYDYCTFMSITSPSGLVFIIGVFSVCLTIVTCGTIAIYRVVRRHRHFRQSRMRPTRRLATFT